MKNVDRHDTVNLAKALRALAEDDRQDSAPPHVERSVMDAWERMQRGRIVRVRRSAHVPRSAVLAAAVAAACVVIGLVVRRPDAPTGSPRGTVAPIASAVQTTADAPQVAAPTAPAPVPRPRRARPRRSERQPSVSPPVVIVSDPLLDATTASVVRVRVPRSALATLGIALVEPDGTGQVDLEMIVGEDGVARAIQRAVPVRAAALQE
jgi:hypothetical protein